MSELKTDKAILRHMYIYSFITSPTIIKFYLLLIYKCINNDEKYASTSGMTIMHLAVESAKYYNNVTAHWFNKGVTPNKYERNYAFEYG